jgi:multicomponent K+:H+ antiporter subunit A
MTDPRLVLPILIIFSGAVLAFISGYPRISQWLPPARTGLILSLAPLSALVLILTGLPWLAATDGAYCWKISWLPSLGVTTSLYMDSLSAFFALLITLIGTLVVIYAGQYFKHARGVWRFFTYILLFMAAMLGLVMAGDVLTLFVFWEGTSIASFLLVAYNFSDDTARKGAFKALFITGGGGIALLLGLLLISYIVGDTSLAVILSSGETLRESDLYLPVLGLVALAAFTKSAQFPFHIWLPDAMSAPTPASAYLHSATMVKAGIYLMARMNPVLGFTEAWFWLLTLTGTATMLTGAILALKRTDLKAILAYSTICQLGILMMMIGQDMAISFKALIIGILAHALYKSALFLVAGIVDHETGTREIDRLGGLGKFMPVSFTVAAVAALSMAGLPPMFGFLAKEALLATALHPSLPGLVSWVLCLASVLAGALMLAISGRLVWDTFMGSGGDFPKKAHDPSWVMLAAPAIPAFLSLFLGQFSGMKEEAALLAHAAGAAFGSSVNVNNTLWHGLNAPLVLSIIAITLGCIIFVFRKAVIVQLSFLKITASMNQGFETLINGMDRLAAAAVSIQQGRLRLYLVTILAGTLALLALFNGLPHPLDLTGLTGFTFSIKTELALLRILSLFLICGTALACILLPGDFNAILAFGASGMGVALLMVLEPAPDVALVQIVVDVLLVIILVLALTRLPADKLAAIQKVSSRGSRFSVIRDGLISAAFGGVVMFMSLAALVSRPRVSALSPFFKQTTKPATGSSSIVGTILTDFRGLDTLFEIAVFGIAGLGIFTLIQLAAGQHRLTIPVDGPAPGSTVKFIGIGSQRMTPLMRVLAHVMLPLTLVIGICDVLYGHDQPGDGFTAGVIISIGIGFQYMVFGYNETRKRMAWLRPSALVGWGILLAIASGLGGLFVTGRFFSPADFGKLAGLTLPRGIHLSSSMIFELAICLSVVGSVILMLNTLGRPNEQE